MLKAENISTGYGRKQVLFDVSFETGKGEIVLLTGDNCSGKSTLLKAIYGMLPQWNNGKIFFDEENITDNPMVTLLDKGLLYISQRDNLFEDLTVKENLQMAGLLIDKNILSQRMESTLSIFRSLVPLLAKIPMKLSDIERQLLTLAMATLYDPKMILIDEPFIGLSSHNVSLIIENLAELNEQNNTSLLIAEHRVAKEYLPFIQRVICLKQGKIFNEEKIQRSFREEKLNPVFA